MTIFGNLAAWKAVSSRKLKPPWTSSKVSSGKAAAGSSTSSGRNGPVGAVATGNRLVDGDHTDAELSAPLQDRVYAPLVVHIPRFQFAVDEIDRYKLYSP